MKPYTTTDAETDMAEAIRRGDLTSALGIEAHLDRLQARPTASLYGAALWYASRGLHVFPLQPYAKKPLPGSHGLKDATTDPHTIRGWWEADPSRNVGIATGHVVDVFDFDGAQAHADWGRRYPTWADAGVTVLGTVSTPRPGGLHVYVPATGRGNLAGCCGPHVDFRGSGGYVVAPPSLLDDRDDQHPGTYRWLRPLTEEGHK